MRWLILTLCLCVPARAADPFFFSSVTNDLVAILIVPTNSRMLSWLGGKITTNTTYFGGPYWYNTNQNAAVDLEDYFPSSAGGRWERLKIGPRSLGSGTADATTYLRGDAVWATPAGGGTVTGTGTDNYIAVWSGISSLAEDANFQWDSTLKSMSIGDVPQVGISLFISRLAAVTTVSEGLDISNRDTSSTASINKYGLAVLSTGTWNGSGANNYGIYIGAVSGGTANYAIYNNNAAAVYLGTGALSSSGAAAWTGLHLFSGTAGNDGAEWKVTGDSNIRLGIAYNGGLYWGPGNAVTDASLDRTGSGTLRIQNNLNITGLTASKPVFTDGSKNLVSTGTVPWANLPVRALNTQYTVVGNVGAGEDDLQSYTLPGGTLSADGDSVVIRAAGITGATANAKTLKFYFGGVNFTLLTAVTGASRRWCSDITVIRTAATVAAYSIQAEYGDTAGVEENGYRVSATGQGVGTWASDSVFKFTGEATADSDISQNIMTIIYYAAP